MNKKKISIIALILIVTVGLIAIVDYKKNSVEKIKESVEILEIETKHIYEMGGIAGTVPKFEKIKVITEEKEFDVTLERKAEDKGVPNSSAEDKYLFGKIENFNLSKNDNVLKIERENGDIQKIEIQEDYIKDKTLSIEID